MLTLARAPAAFLSLPQADNDSYQSRKPTQGQHRARRTAFHSRRKSTGVLHLSVARVLALATIFQQLSKSGTCRRLISILSFSRLIQALSFGEFLIASSRLQALSCAAAPRLINSPSTEGGRALAKDHRQQAGVPATAAEYLAGAPARHADEDARLVSGRFCTGVPCASAPFFGLPFQELPCFVFGVKGEAYVYPLGIRAPVQPTTRHLWLVVRTSHPAGL